MCIKIRKPNDKSNISFWRKVLFITFSFGLHVRDIDSIMYKRDTCQFSFLKIWRESVQIRLCTDMTPVYFISQKHGRNIRYEYIFIRVTMQFRDCRNLALLFIITTVYVRRGSFILSSVNYYPIRNSIKNVN